MYLQLYNELAPKISTTIKIMGFISFTLFIVLVLNGVKALLQNECNKMQSFISSAYVIFLKYFI